MRGNQHIRTCALHLTRVDEVEALYQQKQAHLSKISALEEHQTAAGLHVPPTLVAAITEEQVALRKLEDRLRELGLPADPALLTSSYGSVSEAFQAFSGAQKVITWIEAHYPQRFRQKRDLFNSTEYRLLSKLTGTWNGSWRSSSDPAESGRVIMEMCQIDNHIVGRGMFTNSLFDEAYLEGTVDADHLEINLVTDAAPLPCLAHASVREKGNLTLVQGTYTVQGWDWGDFEAKRDTPIHLGSFTTTLDEQLRKMNLIDPASRVQNGRQPSAIEQVDPIAQSLATPRTRAHSLPLTVFLSYSHKDRPLLEGLVPHLSPLQRQNLIRLWYDGMIEPGVEWNSQITHYLDSAHIILLLISADFLASDFCYSTEMTRAIERHETGEARVVPIILRPVDWKGTPFAKLQALPLAAKPVTEWANDDAAWTNIATSLRAIVEHWDTQP